jgi:hypothetical protein
MLVIKNWNTHFETAQSRKVSNLTWVAIPNNLNSRGYRKIMKHPDRAKVFAAWIILIEIASNSPTRGQLGDEDGAYTPEDLELYSDFPKEDFELAIPFLKEIGWVCEQTGSEVVADSERASSVLGDTVQDSTVQNNNISNKNNKYSPVYGNEIYAYKAEVAEAWEYVPRGKKKFKTKFEKNWISYVIYENVDKLLVYKKFVEYYESEEGTSKYFREAFRLLEDEFWDEERSVWGKDRGEKKFPESPFDQDKIIALYLEDHPEKRLEIQGAIEKAKSNGRGVGAVAIKIWNKYPEYRI